VHSTVLLGGVNGLRKEAIDDEMFEIGADERQRIEAYRKIEAYERQFQFIPSRTGLGLEGARTPAPPLAHGV
jgi:hypothetical protein